MKPVITVCAAIITQNSKFLLAQRPEGAHLELQWEFPGGKIMPGETPEHCIQRELKEELGVDAEAVKYFDSVLFAYPEKKVKISFYVCKIKRGNPRPLQCASIAWVKPEEINITDLVPADRVILPKLLHLMPPGNQSR
ncbi:MAG: 8-oxo-dGTP diphosphatase MutT [Candidatus Aureabacteria bacterium]|nr:8-oxo-dGTP diphosphatase MutT [Candidatus Auribacterota bacterium]